MGMSEQEYQRIVEELKARREGRQRDDEISIEGLACELRRINIRGAIKDFAHDTADREDLLARLSRLPDWRVSVELTDAVMDRWYTVRGRPPYSKATIQTPTPDAVRAALGEIRALLEAA